MSAKREDSLQNLGYTTLPSDKPTKAKLKAAANAAGLDLCQYIRELANQATKDKQGTIDPLLAAPTLRGVSSKVDNLLTVFQSYVQKQDAIFNAFIIKASGGRLGLAGYNGQESAMSQDARRVVSLAAENIAKLREAMPELELKFNGDLKENEG